VCTETGTAIFERRIRPLLVEDHPQTCNQCHLSGIDLGLIVRDTPCQSMACLKEFGLVNFKAPAESKILEFIGRAQPESELITEGVIRAEYEGFLEWIEHSSRCFSRECSEVICGPREGEPFCEDAPEPDGDFEPALLDALGCDDVSIEQLFQDTVYATRSRCFPCHFEDQRLSNEEAPRFIAVGGDCATASRTTLHNVVLLNLLDLEQPTQSLLLLKPLAESAGGVEHGGSDKFHDTDDPGYLRIVSFIEHYAECRGGTPLRSP
jgi:hypothetical protein